MTSNHHDYMNKVLKLAESAGEEIPVAALVVENGEIIAEAINSREADSSIIAHAEIKAMEKAAQIKQDWNLSGCTLYVNLEPCAMCAGAILQAHIKEVVFGAYDVKSGALGSRYNIVTNNLKVTGGVLEEACVELLNKFFSLKR